MNIILYGRPITKKNSQEICINQRTKKKFIRQSERYIQFEKDCLWQLKQHKERLKGPVMATFKYWMPNRRGWPDLVGLIQATQDILEKAKIIENDKYIVSLDGSRIMGIDKDNPRTEVELIASSTQTSQEN